MLSLLEHSKVRKTNFTRRISIKALKCGIFSLIPLSILFFYGIEDKSAWFFGHDYIDDYRYRINNVVHHIGIMVGHFALLVTLSVVGLLISWIIYEALNLSKLLIRKSV